MTGQGGVRSRGKPSVTPTHFTIIGKTTRRCAKHTLPAVAEAVCEAHPTGCRRSAPTHPGEMLLEEFLKPMGLTQRQLAQAIHVPYQRINEIVNGRRGMTPSTALRLEKFLGIPGTPYSIAGELSMRT